MLIFPLLIILNSCPKANNENENKPPVISEQVNPENYEDNYEDDDEEYDSSAAYSQDSDGGAH